MAALGGWGGFITPREKTSVQQQVVCFLFFSFSFFSPFPFFRRRSRGGEPRQKIDVGRHSAPRCRTAPSFCCLAANPGFSMLFGALADISDVSVILSSRLIPQQMFQYNQHILIPIEMSSVRFDPLGGSPFALYRPASLSTSPFSSWYSRTPLFALYFPPSFLPPFLPRC